MYACICNAVTESDIGAAIDSGADTVFEVGCRTNAGTGCGTCQDRIEEIIEARCGVCPMSALQVA